MNPNGDPVRAGTLQRFPRPARALLAAVALLVAFRLALIWMPEHHVAQIDSTRQHNFYDSELAHRAQGSPSPEIVVFGTSRLRRLDTDLVAAEMKLPAAKVLNLSAPVTHYWQILALLRRNPNIVREAKVLLIDVMPFQIFASPHNPQFDTVYFRYSTLAERWNIRDTSKRPQAVADFVVPIWSERMTAHNWRRAIRDRDMTDQEKLDRHRAAKLGNYADRIRLRKLQNTQTIVEQVEVTLSTLFPSANMPMPEQMEALQELRRIVPNECTIVLLWLPIRENTLTLLRESEEWGSGIEPFREYFDSLDMPNTLRIWHERPSDADFLNKDYGSDGIHFTNAGMRKTARHIASIANGLQDSAP